MIVYLVTDGDYSDYRVLGVYSTEEKAKDAQRAFAADGIEEMELDWIPDCPPGLWAWYVSIKHDGTVERVQQENADGFAPHVALYERTYPAWERVLLVYCWACDEDHAVKIAGEKRIKEIACGRWVP